jgi:hypothetical protein
MLNWILISQMDWKAEPFLIFAGILLGLVLIVAVLEYFE